ncbi:MAG TPA: hypothetical protein VN455_11620 [Methanotrichaceae archaeon]|nr:hypothetical protein [Methanotrichaceae archaeon]
MAKEESDKLWVEPVRPALPVKPLRHPRIPIPGRGLLCGGWQAWLDDVENGCIYPEAEGCS